MVLVFEFMFKGRFFPYQMEILPHFASVCPSNSGSKWTNPILSANLGGKFTIGCRRRQEGWHILRCGRSGWMDQGSWWSYIFCGAAVFCNMGDDSICNDKVVLFVLWHCAVAVVVVCCGYAYILIHFLYLIYTWFVWWFLLWLPSSLLSWSVLVTWRTCKNFGCQSSCLV